MLSRNKSEKYTGRIEKQIDRGDSYLEKLDLLSDGDRILVDRSQLWEKAVALFHSAAFW